MNLVIVGCLLSLLLLQGYFKLARSFGILDYPNMRSSHQTPTIRGGGIIFPVLFILYAIISNAAPIWVVVAIALVGIVSFWDDIQQLPVWVRLPVHIAAAAMVAHVVGYSASIPVFMVAVIGLVGFMNAFNFMDGINGITGLYALVFFGTLINLHLFTPINLSDDALVVVCIAALLVFGFYNFRRKAVCFAGDVGAVSLALIMGYYWLYLMIQYPNPLWWLLLSVYGVDSLCTLAFRLIRKEPLHKPHRHHTYQNLANEWRWPHVLVSSVYAVLQLAINLLAVWVMVQAPGFTWVFMGVVFTGLVALYVLVKWHTMRHFTIPFYGRH